MATDNSSARYVLSEGEAPDQGVWHREDATKPGVYSVVTLCGTSFYYPRPTLTFRHPAVARDPNYPDCKVCASPPRERTQRYVAFPTTTDQQWHKVDEQQSRTYTLATLCGMQAQYPSRAVLVQPASAPRGGFPACTECDR